MSDWGRRLPSAIPTNERPHVAVPHSKPAVPVSARSRQKLFGNGAPIPVIQVTWKASRNRTSSRRSLGTIPRRVMAGAFVTERRVIPTRRVGDQHVRKGLERIPSFTGWARVIWSEPWMGPPRPPTSPCWRMRHSGRWPLLIFAQAIRRLAKRSRRQPPMNFSRHARPTH